MSCSCHSTIAPVYKTKERFCRFDRKYFRPKFWRTQFLFSALPTEPPPLPKRLNNPYLTTRVKLGVVWFLIMLWDELFMKFDHCNRMQNKGAFFQTKNIIGKLFEKSWFPFSGKKIWETTSSGLSQFWNLQRVYLEFKMKTFVASLLLLLGVAHNLGNPADIGMVIHFPLRGH